MFENLQAVEGRFEEIGIKMTDPSVISDTALLTDLMKEHRALEPLVETYRMFKKAQSDYDDAMEILNSGESDKELKELAEEEMLDAKQRIEQLTDEIKILLLPKDPNDERNVIVEIRGGAGGEEAALFAAELTRMYTMYAESRHWHVETVTLNETELGGYKEVSFMIEGAGAYSKMKYESGVHRVQRVPQTETQGRIQTSAASVAVFPEAGEFDVDLKWDDIRLDLFCSSGPGGQGVNTTYSAVRLTHIPSGLVVQCQEERSQLKNKDRAFEELRTRLYNLEHQKYLDEIASKRKTMVSTGDRSAKIRTYNYPQGRVTDHRINWSMYNLPVFMNGDIQEVIDQLQIAENAERLKEAGE